MSEPIPIFPLHTVLFPGSYLPLQIFEARYLDLVSDCLRHDSGFGVCLIMEGSEVGPAALTTTVGTYARIRDWRQNPDGLLGITIEGERRFRLGNTAVQADHLVRGEVVWLEDDQHCPVPARFRTLQALASQLISRHDCAAWIGNPGLDDAVWLGYRLAELMPIGMQLRQTLLELSDPLRRLAVLQDCYIEMQRISAD